MRDLRQSITGSAVAAPGPGRFPLPVLIGAGLLAVALMVMAGWVLQKPALLRLLPGYLVTFNSALCFAAAGLALMCNGFGARLQKRVQTAAGAVILLLAGAVLSQYVTGTAIGLDGAALHAWMPTGNPHPGRMAPATCVAFVLAGACLIAMHHAPAKTAPILVRTLIVMITGIGLAAAIGEMLNFAAMFEIYLFRQVSLPTDVGLMALGTGLWMNPWRPASGDITEDERIVYTGAVILVTFGFILSLTGLAAVKYNAEDALGDGLLLTAKSRVSQLVALVDHRIESVESIATRPGILRLYRELMHQPDKVESLEFLDKVAVSELAKGFRSIVFRDRHGRRIAGAGSGWSDSAWLFSLKRPYDARIYWQDDFTLLLEVPVRDGAEVIGTISSQQTLTAAKELVFDGAALGDSGELALCSADERLLYCAPSRLRRGVHEVPRRSGKRKLPMEYAIEGKSGTLQTIDYRNHQVLAAHVPVGDTGLGLVLKLDTAELFEPLRRQLTYIVPFMLLLLAGGVFVLRLAVKPIAAQLHAGRQQLRLALQASRLALWDLELQSGKVYLSEQWNAMLGGEARPLLTTLAELRAMVHPDDVAGLDRCLGDVLSGRAGNYDVEHRVQALDGSWIWIRSRGEVVERDARGRALRLTGTNTDISVRKTMQQKLQHQATHDALTGLPNRSLFHDRMNQAIARSLRGDVLMAVMYLDIDKFKSINDTLGHDAGDELLKGFSQRLAGCVRTTDTVARLGGDEYAVILESLATREDGLRIAEKIVTTMRPAFTLGKGELSITTSVGLAFCAGGEAIGQDELIRWADVALYKAKAAGRDNWQVFEGGDDAGAAPASK